MKIVNAKNLLVPAPSSRPRLAVKIKEDIYFLSLSQTQRFLGGLCTEDKTALKQGTKIRGHFYPKSA